MDFIAKHPPKLCSFKSQQWVFYLYFKVLPWKRAPLSPPPRLTYYQNNGWKLIWVISVPVMIRCRCASTHQSRDESCWDPAVIQRREKGRRESEPTGSVSARHSGVPASAAWLCEPIHVFLLPFHSFAGIHQSARTDNSSGCRHLAAAAPRASATHLNAKQVTRALLRPQEAEAFAASLANLRTTFPRVFSETCC